MTEQIQNLVRKPNPRELGMCCTCQRRPAKNVVFVNERAPVDGTGWGCVRCGIPTNGAISVICHECKQAQIPIKRVCVGHPYEGTRIPLEMTAGNPFDHDYSKHPEIRRKAEEPQKT
jgi:hypothetical protein